MVTEEVTEEVTPSRVSSRGRELDDVIPSWRFVDNRFHSKDRHQKGEGGWAPGISLFFPLSLTNVFFY
jgi:hypothetical protein